MKKKLFTLLLSSAAFVGSASADPPQARIDASHNGDVGGGVSASRGDTHVSGRAVVNVHTGQPGGSMSVSRGGRTVEAHHDARGTGVSVTFSLGGN